MNIITYGRFSVGNRVLCYFFVIIWYSKHEEGVKPIITIEIKPLGLDGDRSPEGLSK